MQLTIVFWCVNYDCWKRVQKKIAFELSLIRQIKTEKIFQKSTKEKYDAVGCVVNLAHLTLWQPYMSILLRRWMIGMLNKTDMERCCRFNYRIFYASENVAFSFIHQVGTKHSALHDSYHYIDYWYWTSLFMFRRYRILMNDLRLIFPIFHENLRPRLKH